MTRLEHKRATPLLVVEEQVRVEYHQFFLRTYNSPRPPELDTPEELLFAGFGGAVFLSGGTDHIATVVLELHAAAPEVDARQTWELSAEGALQADVVTLVFEGGGGVIGPCHGLPTAGS